MQVLNRMVQVYDFCSSLVILGEAPFLRFPIQIFKLPALASEVHLRVNCTKGPNFNEPYSLVLPSNFETEMQASDIKLPYSSGVVVRVIALENFGSSLATS